MPVAVSAVREIDASLAFKAESIARRLDLLRKKGLRKVLASEFYESVHSNVKSLTGCCGTSFSWHCDRLQQVWIDV